MAEYMLIPLSRGMFAKVSPEDFARVSEFKWSTWVNTEGIPTYAGRNEYENGKRVRTIKMHRFIIGAIEGEFVDHINRDKLDNRRENLRFASREQNGANRGRLPGSNTFRGVYWHRRNKNWIARIDQIHIGSFDDEIQAALQYDRAAQEFYGDFAVLNFPERRLESAELPFKHPRVQASNYRGVSLSKKTGKWIAYISINGKTRNLGSFSEEEDAARAYDEAARLHFGAKARTNFP